MQDRRPQGTADTGASSSIGTMQGKIFGEEAPLYYFAMPEIVCIHESNEITKWSAGATRVGICTRRLFAWAISDLTEFATGRFFARDAS
jgi:hypothetical protein